MFVMYGIMHYITQYLRYLEDTPVFNAGILHLRSGDKATWVVFLVGVSWWVFPGGCFLGGVSWKFGEFQEIFEYLFSELLEVFR